VVVVVVVVVQAAAWANWHVRLLIRIVVPGSCWCVGSVFRVCLDYFVFYVFGKKFLIFEVLNVE